MPLAILPTPEEVLRYVKELEPHENAIQRKLRKESTEIGVEQCCVDPDQAAVLAILVQLTDAQRVLEIGTATGYNALRIAQTLSGDGRLTVCECAEKWTTIAARYWRKAKVNERIKVSFGPMGVALSMLRASPERGMFDMVFVCSQHADSDSFYETSLELVRPGGLVVLGGVTPPKLSADAKEKNRALAVAALKMNIRRDVRVDALLLNVGGGVLIAKKR
jgi:O-methyltransferase